MKDSVAPKPETKAESTSGPNEAEASSAPKNADNVTPTPKAPVSFYNLSFKFFIKKKKKIFLFKLVIVILIFRKFLLITNLRSE